MRSEGQAQLDAFSIKKCIFSINAFFFVPKQLRFPFPLLACVLESKKTFHPYRPEMSSPVAPVYHVLVNDAVTNLDVALHITHVTSWELLNALNEQKSGVSKINRIQMIPEKAGPFNFKSTIRLSANSQDLLSSQLTLHSLFLSKRPTDQWYPPSLDDIHNADDWRRIVLPPCIYCHFSCNSKLKYAMPG